jgi:hypothetical protein
MVNLGSFVDKSRILLRHCNGFHLEPCVVDYVKAKKL